MRKQISLITILTLIFIMLASPVFAEPVTLNAAESASGIEPRAMTMLREGSTNIGLAGAGLLSVNCSTYAYFTVAEVGVTVTLQRWNGSSWVDAQSYPFVNYYASSISKSFTVSVPRGYSYRIVGDHYCANGGTVESLRTFSQVVYVS